MQSSKSLLIAIAAFAVTATGAQAFVGSDVLLRAGLTTEQVSAFQEARTLRIEGEVEKARDVLVQAGIDEEALAAVRKAAHVARLAMHQALKDGDYAAFTQAIKDTPLADIITTEADFELFAEAHELKRSGAHTEAQEIFENLGLPGRGEHKNGHHGKGSGHSHAVSRHGALNDDQHDALRSARQANDRETVRAILDEAGENDGWGR
ncbi:hypothetical protein K2Q16_02955 [Patescibacteria group bacterium]|nr:hypothetical protein [Patescibacteria group bacterium]